MDQSPYQPSTDVTKENKPPRSWLLAILVALSVLFVGLFVSGAYTDITFTVTLTWTVDHTVTVGFHSVDHTASSSYTNQEYLVLTSGPLVFSPGDTSKTITVRIFAAIDSGDTFDIVLDDSGIGTGVTFSSQNPPKGIFTAQ